MTGKDRAPGKTEPELLGLGACLLWIRHTARFIRNYGTDVYFFVSPKSIIGIEEFLLLNEPFLQ
jgi:hypothetical protein